MFFFLNDNQILEGLIGAIGWVIFSYYLKQHFNNYPALIGFIAWSLIWYSRKVGHNLYMEHKNYFFIILTIVLLISLFILQKDIKKLLNNLF